MGMNVSIEGSNPSFSVEKACRRRGRRLATGGSARSGLPSGRLPGCRRQLADPFAYPAKLGGALAIAQDGVVHVHRDRAAHMDAAVDALESYGPLARRFVSNRASRTGKAAVGLDGDQGARRPATDERVREDLAALLARAADDGDGEGVEAGLAGGGAEGGVENGVLGEIGRA